ncbi:hypothetical protein [Photobacterium damselae]|uniref:hypothetical protein n=1 Tax=Photobacterium damselae TaxID=38293 RepID=UPI001F474F78|nr:hypothetical protein [Photobacterium damselae]UKA04841.1 hypothetical protein IHC89_21600 [Photobacterium damselae subsp. damselae]
MSIKNKKSKTMFKVTSRTNRTVGLLLISIVSWLMLAAGGVFAGYKTNLIISDLAARAVSSTARMANIECNDKTIGFEGCVILKNNAQKSLKSKALMQLTSFAQFNSNLYDLSILDRSSLGEKQLETLDNLVNLHQANLAGVGTLDVDALKKADREFIGRWGRVVYWLKLPIIPVVALFFLGVGAILPKKKK